MPTGLDHLIGLLLRPAADHRRQRPGSAPRSSRDIAHQVRRAEEQRLLEGRRP
ncbi:hypothetical protein [Actinoplanes sp. URMC 104]|uniref:hypothetical protein n=1 Tax=Actinoplanes sp. URMC 104 TaxID=3423409 RepID=UPI003F1BCEA1